MGIYAGTYTQANPDLESLWINGKLILITTNGIVHAFFQPKFIVKFYIYISFCYSIVYCNLLRIKYVATLT